ncbi:hypothetical protein HS088_TW01G00218 [Tripterygium wilfordii]|uniref:RRM domain-containing protein n=1 Tax=Tripterygium wilfordii TaxID=458696 RepID=A0A7J7E0Y9_TRIWF|nr:hypothetical protein HS088_TW01G00218 [Tripterygium wilfordii]
MALLWMNSCPCNPLIQTRKWYPAIPRPSISESLSATPIIIHTVRSKGVSETPTKRSQSFPITCCNPSSGPSIAVSQSPSAGVFIKGLPKSTSEGCLKKVFSQFGEVNQVKICMDGNTKESLGYAFLWFSDEESTQSAIEEMNGKV